MRRAASGHLSQRRLAVARLPDDRPDVVEPDAVAGIAEPGGPPAADATVAELQTQHMITVTPAAGGCSRPPRPPVRDPDVRRPPVCGRRTFACTVVGIASERGPRFPPCPNNTPTWIQSTDEYKTKQAGSRKKGGRYLFLDYDPVKRIGEHSCRRRRMVRPRDHQQRCGKRQHNRRRLGPLPRDVRGDGILPGGTIDAWRSVRIRLCRACHDRCSTRPTSFHVALTPIGHVAAATPNSSTGAHSHERPDAQLDRVEPVALPAYRCPVPANPKTRRA